MRGSKYLRAKPRHERRAMFPVKLEITANVALRARSDFGRENGQVFLPMQS